MPKIALVTGASSGIGQAIAVRLAKDGYTVIAHYNSNQSGAENTLRLMQSQSKQPHRIIQFESCDFEKIDAELKDIDVDVLINNAGFHKDGPALLMDNNIFKSVLDANLIGPFYLSKICGKKMLLKRSGNIINIASIAGQTGNAGQANYAASKAGLIALTKTMAMELGTRGIRVNCVAPGLIETEMTKDLPQQDYLNRIPLKRYGKASEVAGVVAFLCSDDASYITANTISVSGGMLPN